MPPVQLIMSSPNAAAFWKVAVRARSPNDDAHFRAASLLAVRDPIVTSCPFWTSFVPSALPTMPVPSTAIFMCSFSFGCFRPEILTQRFRKLHRVRALLQANDDTVAHRPDVREARFESSAGRFRARRIKAQADDSVADFKNLRRLSVPIFKIAE